MVFDPKNKATEELLIFLKIQDGWPSVKGKKSTKFDPSNYILARHLDPVRLIWTKFGMDMLVDHGNKRVE